MHDQLERLARRAVGGDVHSARALARLLEVKAGMAAPHGGGLWIVATNRNKRTERDWLSHDIDQDVTALRMGPFSEIRMVSRRGTIELMADGRTAGWLPANNPSVQWRIDAELATEFAMEGPRPPGPMEPNAMSPPRNRPCFVFRDMAVLDHAPAAPS